MWLGAPVSKHLAEAASSGFDNGSLPSGIWMCNAYRALRSACAKELAEPPSSGFENGPNQIVDIAIRERAHTEASTAWIYWKAPYNCLHHAHHVHDVQQKKWMVPRLLETRNWHFQGGQRLQCAIMNSRLQTKPVQKSSTYLFSSRPSRPLLILTSKNTFSMCDTS